MTLNKSDRETFDKTLEILKAGGVVILPTDTVYGFSACSNIPGTDEKIRNIKGRSETKPFIQLISKPDDIFIYTDDKIPSKLLSFWPGPLTIIVNDKRFSDVTTAFRCPGDEWLRKLTGLCGCSLYSTSVNRSGFPVIGKIKDIEKEFGSEIDLFVSDGDSKTSVPSTIVKIENNQVIILREGAVKASELL